MSEQPPITWKTSKARPRSRTKDLRHTTTVLGLNVEVYQYGGGLTGAYWRVQGYLGDIRVAGGEYRTQELERAKAEGIDAARRLHAAGVRGEKPEPPIVHVEGVGPVRIEPGQDGLYVIGKLTGYDDPMWWKVIERKPGEPLRVIAGYARREDAEKARDALNADPLLRDGAVIRREDDRRVTDASEAQP